MGWRAARAANPAVCLAPRRLHAGQTRMCTGVRGPHLHCGPRSAFGSFRRDEKNGPALKHSWQKPQRFGRSQIAPTGVRLSKWCGVTIPPASLALSPPPGLFPNTPKAVHPPQTLPPAGSHSSPAPAARQRYPHTQTPPCCAAQSVPRPPP